jgi:8-oxo-dGTP pyrophosphatase MutT (NUDIX family)
VKPLKLTGIQYAALPYRLHAGQLQIMLITSRRTRRWIIPKGWPMHGLKPQEAAAQEAAEEAGIVGQIADAPIGSYRYIKQLKGEYAQAVQVIVFPLRVEDHAEAFKEQGQRIFAWFSYQEAASKIAEPSLRRLIRDFGAMQAPGFIAHGLRTYRAWRAGDLALRLRWPKSRKRRLSEH